MKNYAAWYRKDDRPTDVRTPPSSGSRERRRGTGDDVPSVDVYQEMSLYGVVAVVYSGRSAGAAGLEV